MPAPTPVPGPRFRRGRLTAAVLTAGLFAVACPLVLPASPVAAHAHLLRTDPAAAATVDRPVDVVVLTFSEPVKDTFSTVVVTGSDRAAHGTGAPRAADRTLSQAVAGLPAGPVRVAWRTVSVDGHPVEGQFTFTAAGSPSTGASSVGGSPPADSGPATGPGTPSEAGPPTSAYAPLAHEDKWVWPAVWLGVVTLAAACAVGWLLWRRRQRPPTVS